MKTCKTLSVMLVALVIAASAWAQTPPPPNKMVHSNHPKMDHPKFRKMGRMQPLNLTQDQQKQMKQIRLDLSKALVPLRNQMGEKRAKLQTLTTGENADFNAAEKVVDDMANLRAQMMKKGLQSKKQIRDLLTDEQKVKFDAFQGFHKGRNFSRQQWHRHKR